ncbi:MAG: hypothetical protein L6R40_000668 [Gallowayella cf. fulva]|nr:MAG: hypothetical protein L6R40_000668 [Xanthomendoza cf. fulva]
MNRFRSRKKSFHDASTEPSRPTSTESDVPALPIFSSKTFRRNKKTQPEPKPRVDLSTALPPSDNFRTSLMMPNLSARFSMLREQDDPNSKIGKANDDSVLFPKRASRLDLFNSGGFNNIGEDGSIHAPIRPFLASARTESYGSVGTNWTDEDRSMISRARPGEGNTMFGGRQKIYKIPVGSSGSTRSFSNEGAPPRRGKALYGDDLAASTFPRNIENDMNGNESPDMDKDGQGRSSDERSISPPSAKYNRNRETTSSTNSAPSAGRTSTAATSVASQRSMYGGHASNGVPHAVNPGAGYPQASERSLPKSRRLYGQGLDQHMYEQQSSAMHKLESLHKQRTNNAPPFARLQGSRSATSLNGRYQQSGPLYASNQSRAGSPPLSGPPPSMGDFDLGLAPESSLTSSNLAIGRSPPVSPPMSPIQDNTFVAALEPNDLGKATASGAFNKPSQQYSEQQYLERQLQLQQGRESPALVRPFSPSAASIDEQLTGRSRNVSLAGPQPTTSSIVRQRDFSGHSHGLGGLAKNQPTSTRNSDDQCNPVMDSSFLSTMSGTTSEVASPLDSDNEQDLFPPSASYQSSVDTSSPDSDYGKSAGGLGSAMHLETNNRHLPIPDETGSDGRSEVTVTDQHSHAGVPKVVPNPVDADSPTLCPNTVSTSVDGLNGLVRAHLRNDSGQSSIYPEPSPGPHSRFPNDVHKSVHSKDQSTLNEPTTFFRESTFHPESKGNNVHPVLRTNASDVSQPLSGRARQILEQATALREVSPKVQHLLGPNKAQRVLGGEAPRPSHDNLMSWQEQLKGHHARGGSTETEKERESLATELAERRRAVQDNLRTFVENGSRSSSPAPGSRPEDPSQRRTPFGRMKSNTGQDSLASKKEQPSKAMRMLGIGPTGLANGSSRPSQESFSRPQARDHWQPELKAQISQSRYRTQGGRPQQPESGPDSLSKEPSPPASRSSRERSGSEASERRFPGRNVKPRNNTLIEEEPTSSDPTSPAYRIRPKEYSDAPRPVAELMASMAEHQDPERSQSAISGRMRSESRTADPGYFEQRDALPIQPNSPYTRTSPATPGYSVRSAPSMRESSSMLSNDSVPIMIPPKSSHGAHSSPRHHRHHRKESINKEDISEPIFKSCTSSVDVVDLPPGASLKNGMEPRQNTVPPPIPPLNPRRKRTQTLLQALGRLDHSHPVPSSHTNLANADPHNEYSTFSADEGGHIRKPRHKLRKSSSEGGKLNMKARQQAMMAQSPAVPDFPRNISTTASPVAAQFPHNHPQHGYGPHDGAVMF